MLELVLMSDRRVTDVPVVESGEPLVDLEAAGVMAFSDRKRDKNPMIGFVRKGVARRLRQASAGLPSGLRFLGVEAYRPPALQELYFSGYADRLRRLHPERDDAAIRSLASRFVSPPEVAPHPSGAAIDLTLCTMSGEELDLGCPVDTTPEESAGACFTAADGLATEAAENRQIFVDALSSAGLVNYPTEWWHWSFGDRYWAMSTGAGAALYGPADAGSGLLAEPWSSAE
ncbi:M15 family metallopeptidase [Leifsonia sp. NPDC056824]|uniref:M15 family metallopeptidase n=1 Tax=Leifsonia sp. NPDC056824 TaxID=3345953 RepID=UPI0036CCD170